MGGNPLGNLSAVRPFADRAVRRLLFIALLAWACFPVPARTVFGAVLIDRIAAVVNEEVITQSDVDRIVFSSGRIRSSLPDPLAETSSGEAGEALRRLIEKKLLLRAGRRRGIAVQESEVDGALEEIKNRNRLDEAGLKEALAKEGLTLERYREELKEQILMLKLLGREVETAVVVSPSEARAYYEEHRQEFARPGKIRLRQLLIAPAAGESEEEFLKRAERAAREADEHLFSDLGTFAPGELAEEIERAAVSLQLGEISRPIRTTAGFHLIKVVERQGKAPEPFESVQAKIAERLKERIRHDLRQKWFESLREGAVILLR